MNRKTYRYRSGPANESTSCLDLLKVCMKQKARDKYNKERMIKRYERRLLYLINNLLKWMFKKGESVLKEKEFQGQR